MIAWDESVTYPLREYIFVSRHSRYRHYILRVGRIPGPCFPALKEEVANLLVIKPVAEEFQIARVQNLPPLGIAPPDSISLL